MSAGGKEHSGGEGWRILLPAGLVSLGTLVPYLPVLAGDSLFFGDFQAAFVPLRLLVGAAWRRGLPLLTDALRNGHPLLASPFASALYPPGLLFALPWGQPSRLLSLLVLLHSAWGVLGALLLLRSLGRSRCAAAVGAAVHAWCGVSLSSSSMVLLHATWAWIPWVVLAARLAADRPGRARAAGAAGAALLAVLSGDPFMVAAALAGVLLVSLPAGAAEGGDGPAPRRRPLRGAAALGVGLLVALPLLAAQFRFVRSTGRAAALPAGAALERSLGPLEALGFVLPAPFGDPFTVGADGFLAGALFTAGFPLFPGLYVGLLALSFAAAGALRPGRGRAGPLVWLGAGILLALGDGTVVGRAASDLHLLGSLRFPVKWVLGATLPFALLVSRGVDAVFSDPEKERVANRRVFLAVSCTLLLGAVSLAAASGAVARLAGPRLSVGSELGEAAIVSGLSRNLRTSVQRSVLPLLGGIVVVAAGARLRRAGGAPVAGVLVAIDLLAANGGLAPTASAEVVDRVPAAVRILRQDGAARGRLWVDESAAALRVAPRVQAGRLDDPRNVALGRESLPGWVAAGLGLPQAFPLDLEALDPRPYGVCRRLVETLAAPERDKLLSLAGVTHVATLAAREPGTLLRVGEVGVQAVRPLTLYRNLGALPRVRVATRVVAYRGVEGFVDALRRVPSASLGDVAFVEADLPDPSPGTFRAVGLRDGDGAAPPGATLVSERWDGLVLEKEGPAGLLVISDAWFPGWRAEVDGRPVPLLLADLAFRGVPVPAGRCRVSLRYSPFGPP